MKTNGCILVLKDFFTVLCVCLIGFTVIIFSSLYFNTFSEGILCDYYELIFYILTAIVCFFTILILVFSIGNNKFIYKLFTFTIILSLIVVIGLYYFRKSGLYVKIKSIDDFRQFISTFGASAKIIYVLICILQTVILPIPGIITIGAGVVLFGPLESAIYSFIGNYIGSIVAFFIGKFFGRKFVVWFVGESVLLKWQNFVKGKDKALFTTMFLFPFFPDDVLCFVSGVTKTSSKFFCIMMFIVRLFTAFVSTYSLNNSFIPYNTLWGIVVWVLIILAIIIVTFFVYKNGEKIETVFAKKIDKIRRK